MGICHQSNNRHKILSLKDLMKSIPPKNSTPNQKVLFFDNRSISYHNNTNRIEGADLIYQLIQKMDMNDQRQECMEQVKELIQAKNELLIRGYNQYSPQSIKMMQKLEEYYTNYYLTYMEDSDEIPLVKSIIGDMSLQLSIECILIVNALMDSKFRVEQIWWTSVYFSYRVSILKQTQSQLFDDQMYVPQVKEEMVAPVLEFIQILKNRLDSKRKMLRSSYMTHSTQVFIKEQNAFSQNLILGMQNSFSNSIMQQFYRIIGSVDDIKIKKIGQKNLGNDLIND